MRIGPRHPWLGAAGFHITLAVINRYYRRLNLHRATSAFARTRIKTIGEKIARGETALLAGISAAGTHNTGVALVEVTRDGGPHLLFNNEEERYSGVTHTNDYPGLSIAAMREALARSGRDASAIDGWFSGWDYAAFAATLARTFLEEAPASMSMLVGRPTPLFNLRDIDRSTRVARHVGRQLGTDPAPLICTPHHENHAWFSYAASPFAQDGAPVLVAVLDGVGDIGAISIYRCANSRMQRLYCNDSVFDSLGIYYAMISSTQGGWTWLSSEGRYMGATAYGDTNRATNPYYALLKTILHLAPEGRTFINRDLANWPCDIMHTPYTQALVDILGPPIAPEDMWNPDAVLRVEDIQHSENTRERFDKAAATQMVFEDALFHVIDHWIATTGCRRLVLTGGIGLNALGDMRLMERFEDLHLWVPPTPNDAGIAIGAAYMGAYLADHGVGAPIRHAFYCGLPPSECDIRAAFAASPDVDCIELPPLDSDEARERLGDFMAYMTAQDAIFALYQGTAETGPRALGHRSILANRAIRRRAPT